MVSLGLGGGAVRAGTAPGDREPPGYSLTVAGPGLVMPQEAHVIGGQAALAHAYHGAPFLVACCGGSAPRGVLAVRTRHRAEATAPQPRRHRRARPGEAQRPQRTGASRPGDRTGVLLSVRSALAGFGMFLSRRLSRAPREGASPAALPRSACPGPARRDGRLSADSLQ